MMDNRLFTALVAAVLCVAAFLLGSFKAKNGPFEPIEPKVDTLYIRDTIRVPQPPKPAKVAELRDSLAIVLGDSLRVALLAQLLDSLNDTPAVVVPREQAEIRDSLYTAWISGYRPQLDSIEIYQTTQTVTICNTLPAPRWSVGIQAGVGLTPKGVQPYIGAGISYRLPLSKK